jgi:hypothetical protein
VRVRREREERGERREPVRREKNRVRDEQQELGREANEASEGVACVGENDRYQVGQSQVDGAMDG